MTRIEDLDTPALLVDLDRMRANICDAAHRARAAGKQLRPHAKTHKTPEIGKLQIAAGAIGLTVAKVGEAEVMARAGIEDLFIANQVVGPHKIDRVVNLAERARITLGADSVEAIAPLSLMAAAHGVTVAVRIEVDTGLGRAGVRSVEEAAQLARAIAELPGLVLSGLFTHEGHLYRVSPEHRAAAAADVDAQLTRIAERLAEQGTPVDCISAGSTPGFDAMLSQPHITELRPGTYIFSDRMQMDLGAQPSACAVTVLTTVTSVRNDGRVVVDAGSKSLAGDKPFSDGSCGEILGRPEIVFEGMSEEHGHLRAPEGHNLRVGDRLRIIPNHVCTCVNMHERMHGCVGDAVEETWQVAARGKIQ